MKDRYMGLGVLIFATALFFSTFARASAATFAAVVDNVIGGLGTAVVRFIFALAVIYFMWGVVQYGFAADESSQEKARQIMLWGIIGLTVMFTVYGLIRLVQNTLLLG